MNHKQKAIELLNIGHKCEVCGQPVKIYSGDEGTNHYEGLAVEVVVGLLEEMELKIGVWLCPKCKRGCPSGKICRDCLEQELQSLKTKYQELKGKLFQTILESGLNTEARGYMVELGLDVNKREALNRKSVKRLENAILKYLEATNDK